MAGEDPEHLRRIRRLPCCMCKGRPPVEAHHPIGLAYRGMSQRSHDHDAIPLCAQCHRDFHTASGLFKGMPKAERKAWQATMSEFYAPVPAEGVF